MGKDLGWSRAADRVHDAHVRPRLQCGIEVHGNPDAGHTGLHAPRHEVALDLVPCDRLKSYAKQPSAFLSAAAAARSADKRAKVQTRQMYSMHNPCQHVRSVRAGRALVSLGECLIAKQSSHALVAEPSLHAALIVNRLIVVRQGRVDGSLRQLGHLLQKRRKLWPLIVGRQL